MLDFKLIGSKITEIRKRNNMTQDDVAEKLFMSRQVISKWENGISLPSIEALLDLCEVLNTTFDEVLCLNNKEDNNNDWRTKWKAIKW